MDVEYRWQFKFRGNQMAIDMKLIKEEVELLRAGFSASIAPLTSGSMRQFSWRYTLQNALSMARIYYNALVLWFNGLGWRFFGHLRLGNAEGSTSRSRTAFLSQGPNGGISRRRRSLRGWGLEHG